MTRRVFFALTLILGATLLLSTGCQKGGLSGLVPCSGVLLYNGEPVADAQLMFASQDGATGRSATAKTGPNGEFQATTLNANDGILPGTYKITARKMSEGAALEEGMSDAEIAAMGGGKDEMQDLLPLKYAAPATTDLTVTVDKPGLKDYKIELTD